MDRWWRLAEGITASCFELWASTSTGLAPEFSKAPVIFWAAVGDVTVSPVSQPVSQVSSKAPHKFVEAGAFADGSHCSFRSLVTLVRLDLMADTRFSDLKRPCAQTHFKYILL